MAIASPIRYPGGKSHMLRHLIPLVPPASVCPVFVDHTAGGLSLLLSLDPESRSEIANDLNEEVTDFWRALKNPESFFLFQRYAETTPFSEKEWKESDWSEDSYIGRPFGFFVRCRMSIGGQGKTFSPPSGRIRRGMGEHVSSWISSVEGLPAVHSRLRRVLLTNKDVVASISSTDAPNVFGFIDPPYLAETRVSKNLYRHEMTPEQHEALLVRLTSVKGKFLLCGYPSAMYSRYAEASGWRTFTFNVANSASKKKTKPVKQEMVWTNYDPGEWDGDFDGQ